MMKVPQAGRVIAALRCRGRGKSALHRARRRVAPGAGISPMGVNLPKRATENKPPLSFPWGWEGEGEKVV
jgi:hypothetical protein